MRPTNARQPSTTGSTRTVLPEGAAVLGPVPVALPRRGAVAPAAPRVRALVVVSRASGSALAAAVHAGAAVRSARKDGGPVTVRVDPVVLG